MRRGIAIVGAHRGSKLKAPYGHPSCEIWSCSERNENELPRVDIWFGLHPFRLPDWPKAEYLGWLAGLRTVYTRAPCEEIPGAVSYPKDEMVERFGRFFFENPCGSTPAWMMALAITRKPPAIGIYGVHAEGDFAAQGHGMQHFMQIARREGIEIICPTPLDAPGTLYAFEEMGSV